MKKEKEKRKEKIPRKEYKKISRKEN